MTALAPSVIDLTGEQPSDEVEIVTDSVQSPDSKQKRKRKRNKQSTRSSLEAGEIENLDATVDAGLQMANGRDHSLPGPAKPASKRREDKRRQDRTTTAEDIRAGENVGESSLHERKKKERKRRRKAREDADSERRTVQLNIVADIIVHSVALGPSKLFFEDVTPADIQEVEKPSLSQRILPITSTVPPGPSRPKEAKLLLPAHVEVLPSLGGGVVPVEILPPSEPDSDSDAIEYLDYDDRKASAVGGSNTTRVSFFFALTRPWGLHVTLMTQARRTPNRANLFAKSVVKRATRHIVVPRSSYASSHDNALRVLRRAFPSV